MASPCYGQQTQRIEDDNKGSYDTMQQVPGAPKSPDGPSSGRPQQGSASQPAVPQQSSAAQISTSINQLIQSLEGACVGNYRLMKRIGGGGFGDVYRAEHIELGNPFAIKVLHKHYASDPSFVERFRTEAMLLAGLQHENVVSVVDFGEHPDIGFYLVMEWLEGRTLHRVWRRKRNFPLSQIYALFSQLLDALEQAHRRGIVHRDMKPENLMLTKGSRGRTILKIVDFGIATLVRGKDQSSDSLAKEGLVVGTPYYMSPEQAAGRHHEVDGRTDIYACGVILFEILTGRRLYPTKKPKEIIHHQIHTPPPKLESIPGKLYSPLLQAVLDRALAKAPGYRYPNAAEMFAELEFAMKAEGVEPDEEGIDSSQARNHNPASLTNLLDLAMGNEALATEAAVDEKESLSTGAGYRGQKANSAEIVLDDDELDELLISSTSTSKSSWYIGGGAVLAMLVLLLLGLQAWGPGPNKTNAGTNTLALPPVLRPPTPPEPRKTDKPAQPIKSPVVRDKDDDDDDDDDKPTPRRVVRKKPRLVRKRRRRRRGVRRRRRRRKVVRRQVRRVRLVVTTMPPLAKVYVNKSLRGTTPTTIRLPQGKRYLIQVKLKGFVTQTFRWNGRRNLTKKIKLIEDLF